MKRNKGMVRCKDCLKTFSIAMLKYTLDDFQDSNWICEKCNRDTELLLMQQFKDLPQEVKYIFLKHYAKPDEMDLYIENVPEWNEQILNYVNRNDYISDSKKQSILKNIENGKYYTMKVDSIADLKKMMYDCSMQDIKLTLRYKTSNSGRPRKDNNEKQKTD